jgi:Mg-chelatase subunit ChlD
MANNSNNSNNINNSNNNNDVYDDDRVGSRVRPRSPSPRTPQTKRVGSDDDAEMMTPVLGTFAIASNDFNGAGMTPAPAVVEDRPADSVKACKNICVIFAHDLSGSMDGSRKLIADGTNEFVQDLQKRYAQPCEFNAMFCLITFSGETITVGEWTDIHSMPVFRPDSFVCNGTTPLWDASAIGIDKMERECQECTAALYVFTDGEDNNSRNANRNTIRDRIAKMNPAKHTMLFIGSDPLSSAANAAAIGVARTKSLNPSSDNTPSAMRACTNTIARCVTGETQTPEFNDSDIIMSEGPSVGGGVSAQSYDMIDMIDHGDGSQYYEDTSPIMRTPSIARVRSAGGR